MIKLLVVDDDPCVRQGLRMRLGIETDLQVIGEASNGAEALLLTVRLQPDVVLMDIEMPIMGGIAATARLHDLAPMSRVVILSSYDSPKWRAAACAAGAFAYVSKLDMRATLVSALRQAADTSVHEWTTRPSIDTST
jgi:DNA-binding NarL/FixJ family response regulator